MEENFDCLKLENQLCFPLYACSKEIVRKYKIFLDKIDLTYTQYIVMMVLWDKRQINVKSLGEYLFLDSGNLIISITQKGTELKNKAKSIPIKIKNCVNLSKKDSEKLYSILYKILNNVKED